MITTQLSSASNPEYFDTNRNLAKKNMSRLFCTVIAFNLTLFWNLFAQSDIQIFSPTPLTKGANCLFIGHSFFVPVAKAFEKITHLNDFPDHQAQFVFASGHKGAPGSLWKSSRHKSQIEEKLSSKKIELLGMASFGKVGSSYEDYKRWIDLALKYNPETNFFIGASWTFRGPRASANNFNEKIEKTSANLFETVKKLRKDYPNTKIFYANYGKVAALMKSRFEKGNLEDITINVGRGKNALFMDRMMGHGGKMMLDLSAMYWLNILYGGHINELKNHTYHTADVEEILSEAIRYHQNTYLE